MKNRERLIAAAWVLGLVALAIAAVHVQADTINHKRSHAVGH